MDICFLLILCAMDSLCLKSDHRNQVLKPAEEISCET